MGSEASLQNWKRGISNFNVTTSITCPELPTLNPDTYITVKNHSHLNKIFKNLQILTVVEKVTPFLKNPNLGRIKS
jgi:hypothetical protein